MRGRPWPPPLARSDTLLFLAKFPLDSPVVGVRSEPPQAGEDAGTQVARPPTSSRSEHPGGGSEGESLSLPGRPLRPGRDCPPWAHPLAGTPTLVSGSLPHFPSPWLASSPLCQGPCPLSLPPMPAQTDLVAQARRAGEIGTERRPFFEDPSFVILRAVARVWGGDWPR